MLLTLLVDVAYALEGVAVGDLFTAGEPEPDFSAGGSLVNWGPVLSRILELDFDVVVSGTGPPATRADLETFKSRLDTLTSRATELGQERRGQGSPDGRVRHWRSRLATPLCRRTAGPPVRRAIPGEAAGPSHPERAQAPE